MGVQQSVRSVLRTGCGTAPALCSQHGILAQKPITAVAVARLEIRSTIVNASAFRIMFSRGEAPFVPFRRFIRRKDSGLIISIPDEAGYALPMMRCPYFMLLAVASAVVACGSPEPTRAPTPSAAEPAARYDLEFIDTALKHHAVAAEIATMTQGRAQRPELKGLATSILDQTNREMLQLRALRDRWYSVAENAYQPHFPGALSMKMDHGSLQREDPANFDLEFLALMIPHQESMITMATDAQQKATRAEVRQVAAGMMPGLQRDVTRMREWERAWRQ